MTLKKSPLIDLQDVHLTLPSLAGPVPILRGMNLQVEAGETLGITGPSGSGKTSLLLVISGLEAASSGRVEIAGQDLRAMNEDGRALFRREHLAIVFQSFHLIPTLTALENVAVPLEFKKRRDAADLARHALERVGLSHRLSHYPGQLSGGEQQRVAIARAIAADVPILLADEPTGNLDQETGHIIIDLLFELAAETKKTLIFVTHDEGLAKRCHRRAGVRDGLIVDVKA